MMLARTRREGTMLGIIIALVTMLIVTWSYISVNIVTRYQPPQGETIQGPNQRPTIEVTDVKIDVETESEASIFLIIDMGSGNKFKAHVTIPVYRTH